MIDWSTPFGTRVAHRLEAEIMIWLTTVGPEGVPHPSPVWFLWSDQQFLIFSQPNKPKLRNILQNPNVALNFDGNGQGGDIMVFRGQARLDPHPLPAQTLATYFTKYRAQIARLQWTPESMMKEYSQLIRIIPAGVRGH